MSSRAWTKEQREAIGEVGRNVLVSAGAGSGKTSVLAERCAFLVADARPACDVDRLLVVTFTDAAAAEMRHRIIETLRRRQSARPSDARLTEQIALVDTAAISTMHSFCRRVLGRFFAKVGLDPGFRTLDAHEARLLRRDVLDDLMRELHSDESPLAKRLDALVAEIGQGRDETIRGTIDELAAFLESVVDADEWLAKLQATYAAAKPGELSAAWSEELRRTILEDLVGLIDEAQAGIAEMAARGMAVLALLSKPLDAYRQQLEEWHATLDRDRVKGVERVREKLIEFAFPKMPRKDATEVKRAEAHEREEFERRQGQFTAIREGFKKFQARYGLFSIAEYAEGIAMTAPHVATMLDLVQEFRRRYVAAKRELVAVDFSDLERLTLHLLRDPQAPDGLTLIAKWLRSQYEHLLVDEYQDINPVQAEILRRVSRQNETGRTGNQFAVGDVKQSIYRFRLAEPGLFIARQQSARDPRNAGRETAIDLNANFRSGSGVLRLVNAMFSRLMAADLGGIVYDDRAALRPGTAAQESVAGPAVELAVLAEERGPEPDEIEETGDDNAPETGAGEWERIEREAWWVARRIDELRRADPMLKFGDIAILMRSPQIHATQLVRTLERQGVPVFAELTGGFFDSLEIRDVLAFLSVLDNAQQNIPLAAWLRSPLCPTPLNDSQLVAIRAAAEHGEPFCFAVSRYAEQGADVELRRLLRDALGEIERRRADIRQRPLPDVLAEILRETGYAAYAAALPEGPQRTANLTRLHEHARDFGEFSRQGLHRFLAFLDQLRDEEADLGAAPALAASADVVRVMSIHRSKGLEFPVVFVVELGKRFNLRDSQAAILVDRRLGLGMRAADVERRISYPTLPHQMIAREVRRQSLAEEIRTLYVAMTRAKNRLVLVGSGSLEELAAARAGAVPAGGPLPLHQRAAAVCYLDWLLAVLRTLRAGEAVWPDQTPGADALLTVSMISSEEMRSWTQGQTFEPDVRARLEAFAALGPPDKAFARISLDTVAARAAMARLTARYGFERLTQLPAVVAASALKQRFDTTRDPENPAAGDRLSFAPRLAMPMFIETARHASPTQRGVAVHAFLQRVDLSRICDEQDLGAQREGFVHTGQLAPEEAAELDLAALAWFFSTEVGGELRERRATARREEAFVFGMLPTTYDADAGAAGDDRIIVRGVIDCFFETPSGVVLLDYKTDGVAESEVAARTKVYGPQLRVYAEALAAIWKKNVTRRVLVFLGPRRIVIV